MFYLFLNKIFYNDNKRLPLDCSFLQEEKQLFNHELTIISFLEMIRVGLPVESKIIMIFPISEK